MFEYCTDASYGKCKCDRTQQIYHSSVIKTFGHLKPPGRLEKNGCVNFGQISHSLKPAKILSKGANAMYNLPNDPIQGLKASQLENGRQIVVDQPADHAVEYDGLDGGSCNARSKRPISPKHSSRHALSKRPMIQKEGRSTSLTQMRSSTNLSSGEDDDDDDSIFNECDALGTMANSISAKQTSISRDNAGDSNNESPPIRITSIIPQESHIAAIDHGRYHPMTVPELRSSTRQAASNNIRPHFKYA